MDWQKCMNQALEYIESNLPNTIDYSTAARFTSCSEWEFRRLFSFIAQIPLSEYVRLRRLTMAAADIRNGDKLIDVALRYRYESQAAFSRAFRQLHGVTPSAARDKSATLKPYPRLTFKLILMEGIGMDKNPNVRTNIIGSGEVGYAISVDMDRNAIYKTNSAFWDAKGNDFLGAISLPLYGAFVSEEKCRLFGDVSGKKMLEIGCGNGQSLQYLWEHNASELWAMDISERQIEKAKKYVAACGISANLICSPMEEECGIPVNYFDFVYSIYAIGWTADLEGTFRRIASYLKKDGTFIFSWSHPIHKCVAAENDMLTFKKCYFDESWYSVSLDEGVLTLSDRKLSTYVNALAKAGFVLEQMVEESDEEILQAQGNNSDFAKKAEMLPVTFVVKARKL